MWERPPYDSDRIGATNLMDDDGDVGLGERQQRQTDHSGAYFSPQKAPPTNAAERYHGHSEDTCYAEYRHIRRKTLKIALYLACSRDIDEIIKENFCEIRTAAVFRVALWILGEYAEEPASLKEGLKAIIDAMGKLPLVEKRKAVQQEAKDDDDKSDTFVAAAPVILADGTYATQGPGDQLEARQAQAASGSEEVTLRSLVVGGDYFLATAVANAFTKLVLRFAEFCGFETAESHKQIAEGILLVTSMLR
eukprot:776371_1